MCTKMIRNYQNASQLWENHISQLHMLRQLAQLGTGRMVLKVPL